MREENAMGEEDALSGMVATPPKPPIAGSNVDGMSSNGMPLIGMSPALVLAVTACKRRGSGGVRALEGGESDHAPLAPPCRVNETLSVSVMAAKKAS